MSQIEVTLNVEFQVVGTSRVIDNIPRKLRFLFSYLTFNSLHHSMIGGAKDVPFQFALLSAPYMWMGANVSIQLEKEL